MLMRTVRAVEQGVGRSVRGEKDYSGVVVTGSDLVRLIREKTTGRFLSPQVSKQIEIGLEVADMARQDVTDGEDPPKAFVGPINKFLLPAPEWKPLYADKRDGIIPPAPTHTLPQPYTLQPAH